MKIIRNATEGVIRSAARAAFELRNCIYSPIPSATGTAGPVTFGHPNGLSGTLKVAVAQTVSNSTDTLEANAQKHASWLDKAGKEGARDPLPELSMTGYFAERVLSLTGKTGSAQVANKRLQAAEGRGSGSFAKRNNICAIIGIPVFFEDVSAQNPKPWYNTALVIGPNGTKEYRRAQSSFLAVIADGAAGSDRHFQH